MYLMVLFSFKDHLLYVVKSDLRGQLNLWSQLQGKTTYKTTMTFRAIF